MLFDTHAHIDDRAFDADRNELLAALPGQGVGLLMNPGCSLASSRNAVRLAQEYDYIYAAVGSHPDAADEVDDGVLEEYRMLCKQNPKVRAIGEIGLDYHYEDVPRALQQKAFRAQMALARELNLPVIVHEREAHEDGLRIVEEFPEVKGVFHCYSGSGEMAKWLIARGWYIGFTGVLTFKNARKALEVASSIPLDRIVLETDCPYMSPEPFRGKRNDPGKLYRMAEKLAEIRGLPLEEIHRITVENGKRLYRLEGVMTVMELELRPRGVQEAETYFERSGDAEICRMLPRTVTTLQEALANYRASQLPGAASFGRSIYLDGRHVGDVWCYCMEPGGEPEAMVSFCIFEKNCWGKGIASRAVEEFLAEVRDRFGLKRIGAFVYADNAASLRVLQKNGFICRERFVEDGRESCYLERES